MSSRILPDWINGFREMTYSGESPEIYKEWVAVSTIAAALQRKCFTQWESIIYPNLYIVLVGGAGAARKGTIMAPALDILKEVGIKVASNSITREALIEQFINSMLITQYKDRDGNDVFKEHCSLTVFSKELAVFIGEADHTFMVALIDWYDCDKNWEYKTKKRGDEYIRGVFLNLIGATTPTLLYKVFPVDTAIGAGLASRTIFVYADRKSKINALPFPTKEELDLKEHLIRDLGVINTLSGEFILTEEFARLYVDWYEDMCENPPIKEVLLTSYLERRATHLRKICMIMSASRSDEMVLRPEDFHRAVDLMVRTEKDMPKVFGGYGKRDVASLFEPLIAIIMRAGSKGVTFTELIAQFYKDLSKEDLKDMIATLESMGKLEIENTKEGLKNVSYIRWK